MNFNFVGLKKTIIRINVPMQFEGASAEQFGALFGQALAVRERELNRRHKEEGRLYLGAKKVRRQLYLSIALEQDNEREE